MAVTGLLAITVPFRVNCSIANVAAEGATVSVDAPVAPAAAAVTITEPAPVPAANTLNLPVVSVRHGAVELQAGLSVTAPAPPPVDKITGVFAIALLPASFTVMLKVAGVLPLSGRLVADELTVTVEPVTGISKIC